MSIIAVNGLPAKFKITDVVKALAKAIGGHFEALNFKVPKGKNKNKMKTCYLRLSEKLDPVRIVEKINDFSKQCHKNYRAVVPEKVPDVYHMKTQASTTEINKKDIKTHLNNRLGKDIEPMSVPKDQLMWQLLKKEIKKEYNEDSPRTLANLPINRALNTQEIPSPAEQSTFIRRLVKQEMKEECIPGDPDENSSNNRGLGTELAIKQFTGHVHNSIPNLNIDTQVVANHGRRKRARPPRSIRNKVVLAGPSKQGESISIPELKPVPCSQAPHVLERLPVVEQLTTFKRDQHAVAKHRRKKRARPRKCCSAMKLESNNQTRNLSTLAKSETIMLNSDVEETGAKVKLLQAKAVALRTDPASVKPLAKNSEIPLGTKPKRLPLKLRMALRIPDDDNYDEVLKFSTEEIMTELQAKYPGLHSLSKTTGYKLTRELTKKVFTRVEALAQKKNQDFSESCFKMTRGYRRAHPHFGDFQFVLSTLHAIQDANGIPRSQLQESDLTSTPTAPLVLDLPKEKINQLCNTYTAKIVKRMSSHILGLHSAVSQLDTEEELARKQVREELKKLNPFLPDVVSLVVQKHLSPKDGPFYRVRIYGEPFLPNKETMHPFITKYKPVHVMRSSRMYNMIKFNVPPAFFHSLMAMNGTVLNGAKLSICSSDVAKYNRKHGLLGGADENEDEDEEMEEDQNEEWDEMEEEL